MLNEILTCFIVGLPLTYAMYLFLPNGWIRISVCLIMLCGAFYFQEEVVSHTSLGVFFAIVMSAAGNLAGKKYNRKPSDKNGTASSG